MNRLPRGHKAQIQGQRMFQTMYTADQMRAYAAQQPRQWQGLTDEEIQALDPHENCWELFDVVRAAEAKLKEKNT